MSDSHEDFPKVFDLADKIYIIIGNDRQKFGWRCQKAD
jgi:hypothetical protein